MKKRSFIICSFLLLVLLTFSGCGGRNSFAGGHISTKSDSNPFLGTWYNETTRVEDAQTTHRAHVDQLVFSNSTYTEYNTEHVNYGLTGYYSCRLSRTGTWYFLNDGNHLYIKPTSHGVPFFNDPESVVTQSEIDAAQTAEGLIPLNVEAHYIYTMDDSKNQFTIRLPTDAAGTVRATYKRW